MPSYNVQKPVQSPNPIPCISQALWALPVYCLRLWCLKTPVFSISNEGGREGGREGGGSCKGLSRLIFPPFRNVLFLTTCSIKFRSPQVKSALGHMRTDACGVYNGSHCISDILDAATACSQPLVSQRKPGTLCTQRSALVHPSALLNAATRPPAHPMLTLPGDGMCAVRGGGGLLF